MESIGSQKSFRGRIRVFGGHFAGLRRSGELRVVRVS